MRLYSNDIKLCLREFSKSLTDRAYTCYLNAKSGSIQDWDHMVSTVNTNFFYTEANYTVVQLVGLDNTQARTWTFMSKDSTRRHRIAVIQSMKMCPHDMSDEYCDFLENLTLPSFSKLMKASRCTNESVKRTHNTSQVILTVRPFPRKKPTVATVEKGQEVGPSS